MFTTVAVLRDPWEAHLLRGRLEAEDIPAIVVHEYYIAVAWHLSFALGGVKVQVPGDRQVDAKAIERLCREGDYKQLLAAQFGDLDDTRCPYCGCMEYQKRRPYPRAALAILISGLVGIVLPPKDWIYGCKACGAAYRYQLLAASPGKLSKLLLLSTFQMLIVFAVLEGLSLIFTSKALLIAIVAGLIVSARWTAKAVLGHDPDQPG